MMASVGLGDFWFGDFLETDVPAVDRDRLPGNVARGRAAEPQNSIGDLLGLPHPPHRHVGLQHRIQLFTLTFSDHLVGHGRLDHARADGVNANATRCVFESSALGESDHSMLCGMVGPAPGTAYKTSKRRTVDDGSASLLAHLLQLELHAP